MTQEFDVRKTLRKERRQREITALDVRDQEIANRLGGIWAPLLINYAFGRRQYSEDYHEIPEDRQSLAIEFVKAFENGTLEEKAGAVSVLLEAIDIRSQESRAHNHDQRLV